MGGEQKCVQKFFENVATDADKILLYSDCLVQSAGLELTAAVFEFRQWMHHE